jgi:hypothetical protein
MVWIIFSRRSVFADQRRRAVRRPARHGLEDLEVVATRTSGRRVRAPASRPSSVPLGCRAPQAFVVFGIRYSSARSRFVQKLRLDS